MSTETPTLDFSRIQEPWEILLKAMELKIEREFPKGHEASGAREVLYFTFKVARNTYKTIAFLCAGKPKVRLSVAFILSVVPTGGAFHGG
jgi:hypothetical protein